MREFRRKLSDGIARISYTWENYGRSYAMLMSMFLAGALAQAIDPSCTLLVFAVVFVLQVIFRKR